MAIERGREWGAAGVMPADAPIAGSDAEAADYVRDGYRTLGLGDGDLARTLGVRTPFDPSSVTHLLPIDVVCVELDGAARIGCVAHVIIGRLLVERQVIAVMNAAFVGAKNLAPRAHPGDGKADIVRFDLSVVDRFKAHQRMRTASHLPHPGITTSRIKEAEFEFATPRVVSIDGRRRGVARRVAIEVRSDGFVVGV